MNTTTHLARHILQFQPNKDAARLCFYHYLIHHCDPDTPLTPKLVENFCRRALSFEHWQEHASNLSQELQFMLQHYNETYILNWSLKDFALPDRWQIISVKNSLDGVYIFEKWVEKNYPAETKKRIFYTPENSFVVVVKLPDGDLEVTQSFGQMLLNKGEIEPLCTDQKLYYNADNELKTGVAHHLAAGPNISVRFYTDTQNAKGMSIRGYIFQKQQDIQGKINDFPTLFYPLKKLEQYFIDKKSDPTYQELIQVMEKALELVQLNHPEATGFAQAAHDRGKTALENIFTNDNMIQVLVDQLEQHIDQA